jgi:hypothetical protein
MENEQGTRFILIGGIARAVICFRGRYKGFLVQQGDYLLGLSRYVYLNSAEEKEEGEGVQPSGFAEPSPLIIQLLRGG